MEENYNQIVYADNQSALTNSLLVAHKFGKKHKHVLQSIRHILETAENPSVLQMFEMHSYINEQNKQQPMYVMNRDGFAMLAMGFTGKEALKFKADFIDAFNKMEQTLLGNQLQPRTQAEIILAQAQQLVQQEKRMLAIENKQQDIENKQQDIEQRQQTIEEKVSEIAVRTKTDAKYSTIVGFANRFGIRVPLEKAAMLGGIASQQCRMYKLETGRIPDPRFGSVKTYPDSVLYDVFEKQYPSVRFR